MKNDSNFKENKSFPRFWKRRGNAFM